MILHKRKTYRNAIRQYRRRKVLRLYEVAHYANLSSRAHLSHWERGRKLPTLTNALKLSAILQCPVEILFLDLFNSLRHDVSERKLLPIKKPL